MFTHSSELNATCFQRIAAVISFLLEKFAVAQHGITAIISHYIYKRGKEIQIIFETVNIDHSRATTNNAIITGAYR